ncbi:MAG: AMP-binding protein [Cytophagaceae bacterium]|nr:AMP-binding protein [Cytophagaceae bacterium]
MNLFDLSLRIKGFDIDAAREKLAEIKSQDPAIFQAQQKLEIVKFHLENNTFYHKLAANADPEDWENLPILTKADLQQPLANKLSSGFAPKNTHVHKTSGSSGHPFIFAKDKFCHALSWASAFAMYAEVGLDLKNSLEARFYGIPATGIANKKERLKDTLSNRWRFPIFDLSDKNLAGFVAAFRRKKYGHINGYTSSIVAFAKYLKQQNLILKEICPTLTHCIVTAEVLFEDDRALLEKQLGIPVYNEYGASELNIIAMASAGKPLKIDRPLLFVEVLDEENKPVEEGKIGKIVVTSLFNKAHPFIRYEIGDLGSVITKNGAQYITKLEGRTSDFAVLPSGKKIPGLAFYYLTKEVINDSGLVKEFVITQTGVDTFKIEYVADADFDDLATAKISNALEKYAESGLQLVFKRKENLDRSKRGKLKQFTSLL